MFIEEEASIEYLTPSASLSEYALSNSMLKSLTHSKNF